jgi:hypothetical protein
MSHVTRIRTRLLDPSALEEAIAELGWSYNPRTRRGRAAGEPFALEQAADGSYELVGGRIEPLRRAYAGVVVRRAAQEAGMKIAAEAPQPDGGCRYVFVPEED